MSDCHVSYLISVSRGLCKVKSFHLQGAKADEYCISLKSKLVARCEQYISCEIMLCLLIPNLYITLKVFYLLLFTRIVKLTDQLLNKIDETCLVGTLLPLIKFTHDQVRRKHLKLGGARHIEDFFS